MMLLVVTWLWSDAWRSSDTGSPCPFLGWSDCRWRWIGLCSACNRISTGFRDVSTKCIRSPSCWRHSRASARGPVTSSFSAGNQFPPRGRASPDLIPCIPQPSTPSRDAICISRPASGWWIVACTFWDTSWPRSSDFGDKSCMSLTCWKFLNGLNFKQESLYRLVLGYCLSGSNSRMKYFEEMFDN